MSELAQTVNVNCPVSQAKMHLDAFFNAHLTSAEGGEQLSALTLKAPGFPGGATLHREVHVRVLRQPHEMDAFDTMSVAWEVPGGLMYPKFHGILNVEGADDYNSFKLALRGKYTPPGGVVGEVFDAAIGHRIAEATAATLLAEIRDSVELSFQKVEAAKRKDPSQPA
jgi:hypothetical protein